VLPGLAEAAQLRLAAAIAEARHARFATALKNASIRIIDVRIRFIRPDVAL